MKKAKCDKDKILDGRSAKWLYDRMLEMNVSVEYTTLTQNLNNKGEWKLTHALAISKIIDKPLEDLFVLK